MYCDIWWSVKLNLFLPSQFRTDSFTCSAQNPEDKREIICDDKLKLIMGGNDRVTMFNMNRYITQHLVEKLDRSAYSHEIEAPEEDDDEDSE